MSILWSRSVHVGGLDRVLVRKRGPSVTWALVVLLALLFGSAPTATAHQVPIARARQAAFRVADELAAAPYVNSIDVAWAYAANASACKRSSAHRVVCEARVYGETYESAPFQCEFAVASRYTTPHSRKIVVSVSHRVRCDD